MLLELFPFVILYIAMAFVYAHFSLTLSLLLLTVTLRGVSNKHCLFLFLHLQQTYKKINILEPIHGPISISKSSYCKACYNEVEVHKLRKHAYAIYSDMSQL